MATRKDRKEETAAAPAAAEAAPRYSMNEKAAELAAAGAAARETRQRTAPSFGAAWRQHGKDAPNTRAQALAAIADLGDTFTAAEAAKALAELHKAGILGSGTPRSYVVAFIKNGYFVPEAEAAARDE